MSNINIGINHILTVDGKVYPAYWDIFNPSLMLGGEHQIYIFEEEITLDELYASLDNRLTEDVYSGSFQLSEKNKSMYTFSTNYFIDVSAEDEQVQVQSFVFVSQGKPWALCKLGSPVGINAYQTSRFEFESKIMVNNHANLTNDLWTIQTPQGPMRWAAMVYTVNTDLNLVATTNKAIDVGMTDQQIADYLSKSKALDAEYVVERAGVGIKLKAKTKTDVNGISAIFIRILWNLGIMIYVDSIGQEEIKNHLTLDRGHELKLLFGLDFQEVTL